MQAHKHKPRPMLQNGIVVWHGSFHDFDENHVYTDYFPRRLHWQMKNRQSFLPQNVPVLLCISTINGGICKYHLQMCIEMTVQFCNNAN